MMGGFLNTFIFKITVLKFGYQINTDKNIKKGLMIWGEVMPKIMLG